MSKRKKTYEVAIIETTIHRIQLEAYDLVHVNELARELWDDEHGGFVTDSLGRADLIVVDEVRP